MCRTTGQHHSVYELKYHLVWITKYRKKVLYGQVAEKLRDLIREICKTKDVEIIKGSISKDHVHLFVSVPPGVAPVLTGHSHKPNFGCSNSPSGSTITRHKEAV